MKFDAGPPEMGNPYREELTELRIDRLGQRVTLFSVLLPLLLAVILALGYLDLKSRVTGLQDTGTTRIEHLAEDLESRFSSLSVRVAQLEQTLSQRLAGLEKNDADLSTRITPMAEDLKRLEAAKAGRKDLEQALTGVEEKIAPLTQALAAGEKALKTLKDHVDASTADLAKRIEAGKNERAGLSQGLDGVKNQVNALSKDMEGMAQVHRTIEAHAARQQQIEADRKTLETELRRELETVRGLAQKKADSLDQRIERLTRRMDQLQRSGPATPGKAAAAAPQASDREASIALPAETGSPPRATPQPQPTPQLKPGQIIEKPLN